jgi:CheY-like chemotaxis protein
MTMADSLTVLVVEDDENLSEIIAETLRVAGYEVRTAHDGLHGISSCMDCLPDVVLTDIQMPGLNGIEMMRCIRAINPASRRFTLVEPSINTATCLPEKTRNTERSS